MQTVVDQNWIQWPAAWRTVLSVLGFDDKWIEKYWPESLALFVLGSWVKVLWWIFSDPVDYLVLILLKKQDHITCGNWYGFNRVQVLAKTFDMDTRALSCVGRHILADACTHMHWYLCHLFQCVLFLMKVFFKKNLVSLQTLLWCEKKVMTFLSLILIIFPSCVYKFQVSINKFCLKKRGGFKDYFPWNTHFWHKRTTCITILRVSPKLTCTPKSSTHHPLDQIILSDLEVHPYEHSTPHFHWFLWAIIISETIQGDLLCVVLMWCNGCFIFSSYKRGCVQ